MTLVLLNEGYEALAFSLVIADKFCSQKVKILIKMIHPVLKLGTRGLEDIKKVRSQHFLCAGLLGSFFIRFSCVVLHLHSN